MKAPVNLIVRNVNSTYSLTVFMAVTSILVWAVIGSNTNVIGDVRLYKELYETIAKVTTGIQNGTQQVYLLEVGKMLNPKDFCSQNRLTPSQNAMERIFKLIDVLPATSSSTISNLKDCRSVAQAYTESLDKVASLVKEEARDLMNVLQEKIPTPATSQWLSLYRYLQYEEEYEDRGVSTCGHTGARDVYKTEGRQESCGSKHWYMEETLGSVLKKWEKQVGRAFVKTWLNKTSTMMELEKKVQNITALLHVQQMGIQEDCAEPFYTVTLSPGDWCKYLDKQVNETEVQALHNLEEQKRLMENELFEAEMSFHLYNEEIVSSESRLKDIKAQLQKVAQEQVLLSVECKITHEEKVCSNYKEIIKKVSVLQHQYAAEKAMSSIYGDKLQHSSEFRVRQDNKLRATTDKIQRIKSQAKRTPLATMAAEAHSRRGSPKQNSDSKLSENGMHFRFTPEVQDYHQLWRLTPEPGGPKEVPSKVYEIATYLTTEATKPQVSAKLLMIDIHRDWLDLSLFNTNYVFQKTNVLISSGRVPPRDGAPHPHPQDPSLLPLFPSAFLLATDIQLTFYNISDPASLFRLAYEPHASGSYGPFSFGPMYGGGDSRRIKFQVDRSRERTVVSLPGAQLIGYICSVVPKFPKTMQ